MSDLAKLKIWDDPVIRGALSWYLDVAENRRPAKFRVAATIGTPLDLPICSEDALWAELNRLTSVFLTRYHAVDNHRPPRHTQFKKGISGNPSRRPRACQPSRRRWNASRNHGKSFLSPLIRPSKIGFVS
jgi:putative pyruvate formate lyase activating enzyme